MKELELLVLIDCFLFVSLNLIEMIGNMDSALEEFLIDVLITCINAISKCIFLILVVHGCFDYEGLVEYYL